MAQRTDIEWTHFPGYIGMSWNPTRGCSKVSPGCKNCYPIPMAHRYPWGKGLTVIENGRPNWSALVYLVEEKLTEPLHWKKPRCVFVNSTSDLFHEKLSNEDIDKVFAVMALCPQHIFIVLTKRAQRIADYVHTVQRNGFRLDHWMRNADLPANNRSYPRYVERWPLPNVILGVSVENQEWADKRIPHLLNTPAACRMVSYEPALGPVDFERWINCHRNRDLTEPLDWIVAGDESGPRARLASYEWYRQARDQCAGVGIPFFMKQLVSGGRKLPYDEWPKDLQLREWPSISAGGLKRAIDENFADPDGARGDGGIGGGNRE